VHFTPVNRTEKLEFNKRCQTHQTSLRAPLQVLPPGELNGMILEPLPPILKFHDDTCDWFPAMLLKHHYKQLQTNEQRTTKK